MTDSDDARFVFNGPVGSVGGHVNAQYFSCNFIRNSAEQDVDLENDDGLTVSASKEEDEVKQPVRKRWS